MRSAFEERLNIIYPLVSNLPGVTINKPQGAFYLFPNVKQTMAICGYENVTRWVEDLLEETGVALVTGEGFGAPENVRIELCGRSRNLRRSSETDCPIHRE